MHPLPSGFAWDPALHVGAETNALTQRTWPRFLIEPSDHPEPGLRFEIDVAELRRRLPVWGLRHEASGRLAANASGVLLRLDPCAPAYPGRGWRYAMEHFATDEAPNALCLLAANVDPDFRGHALARRLLERGKEVCAELGLNLMVGPVRPVRRTEFPALSFAEYLAKRDEHGQPFDPWLRLHTELGAEVLNVAEDSVRVRASLGRWREWTGLSLEQPGAVQIPQGLAPLEVNPRAGIGTYVEPNVWVRYQRTW